MSPTELARLGTLVADDLEFRGYQAAGIVRRLAAEVAQLPEPGIEPGAPAPCPQCGRPIEQPATGRRRTWCSDRCRRSAHRTKQGRIARIDP